MSKRFLVPSFLQQFDTWLLKHKPAAWSARTHLLLYYIFIFSVIVTLACFAAFSDARQYSAADVWATFIGLAAFTGFVVWLIYLLRFNVFKRFGNWKLWEGLKMFSLYFVNIGALVFLAFIPYIVECVNANNAYDDYELGKDINELNLTACRLEYNLLPKNFKADTIELVKADSTKLKMDEETPAAVDMDSAVAAAAEEVYDEAAVPAEYRPNYTSTADTNDFHGRIMNADSLNKISDSLYVIFECPDYIFAGSNYSSEYGKTAKLRSFEIYNKVIKNHTTPDRPALLKRMKALDEKYVTEHYEPEYYSNKTYTKVIEEKYSIREINSSIENIARKKYWWARGWESIVRVYWYISLVITLLLFIFRSTTIKTFFLSLLTAVILLIGTGIIIGVFGIYEKGIFIFLLLYYLLFFVIAYFIKAASVRNALQGIALNFTVFATVFIPLVAVILYFEFIEDENLNHIYDELLYKKRWEYTFYAELAGIGLLIILIEPLFRKLYKRWYSLPGE